VKYPTTHNASGYKVMIQATVNRQPSLTDSMLKEALS
jgi:hypothetical protein